MSALIWKHRKKSIKGQAESNRKYLASASRESYDSTRFAKIKNGRSSSVIRLEWMASLLSIYRQK